MWRSAFRFVAYAGLLLLLTAVGVLYGAFIGLP